VFTPSEEIWLPEAGKNSKRAISSKPTHHLRRSLRLGLNGESHHWLAKSLPSMNPMRRCLIHDAFEDGSLPKDYSICYPKPLLLKGDTATVEQLLSQQAKRFSAAQQHWLGSFGTERAAPRSRVDRVSEGEASVTPGDRPNIWQITPSRRSTNGRQPPQLGLGMKTNTLLGFSLSKPSTTLNPVLQRLALLQQLETGHPPLSRCNLA